jgi:poly-gamma-glutamate capsule biosynthesis protein CapA/YwtB (metallophosphatase superfamily)
MMAQALGQEGFRLRLATIFFRQGGSMRRAPLVGSTLVLASVIIIAQQPGAPAPRDPQRELMMSVADGFTVAAVGDCIIARPVSQTPGFASVGKLIHDADSAFGNFEGTAIDLTRTPAVPQAEFGGVWIIGTPAVAKDLKSIGFDIMSRANNHATDWGLEGLRQTSRALDEAGIVYAGVGEDRAAARGARYFDTDKGRVALISMASTFTPLSRSAPPVGQAPGRPGVNALRTTRYSLVTAEELRALRNIRDEQPKDSVRVPEKEPADEVELFGVHFKAADRRGFTYTIDPVDEREVLKSIRAAKQLSDFVIVTIHAHEPGNWSQEPADFLPKLAHEAIDAGADEFIGHGPHQIRGIEIYHGKPVFYSLGNFIFQLDLLEPVASDLYEQYKMDASIATDGEFNAMWNKLTFSGDVWYQSVVTTTRFEKGRLAEIRLHPVDLNYAARGADRGVPRLATPEVARTILERLKRLSQPFGTPITIEQNTGVIRPPAAPPTTAKP